MSSVISPSRSGLRRIPLLALEALKLIRNRRRARREVVVPR